MGGGLRVNANTPVEDGHLPALPKQLPFQISLLLNTGPGVLIKAVIIELLKICGLV